MKKEVTNDQLVSYGLIVFFSVLYLMVHLKAGLTLPILWYDEGCYIYPGAALVKFGSLMGPILGHDYNTVSMPPLQPLLLAAVFKIFGFTIQIARHCSGVYILIALVFTILTLKKLFWKYPSILICGLFFLNKYFIVVGNQARQESLVIMLASIGLYFLYKNKDLKGLAFLSMTPLAHPMGAPFICMGALFVFIKPYLGLERQGFKGSSKVDKAFVILAIIIWVGMCVYIASNWEAATIPFGSMFAEVGRKAERDALGVIFNRFHFTSLIFLGFMVFVVITHAPKKLLILLFASGSWSIYKIGQEMWYDCYEAYSQMLFTILLLDMSLLLINKATVLNNKIVKKIAVITFTFFIVFWNHQMLMIPNPLEYKDDVSWYGMRLTEEEPYVKQSDIDEIKQLIENLQKEKGSLVVRFIPLGDTLLFHDIAHENLKIWFPIQAVIDEDKIDVDIFHFTKYNPWVNDKLEQMKELAPKAKKIIPINKSEVEKWFILIY